MLLLANGEGKERSRAERLGGGSGGMDAMPLGNQLLILGGGHEKDAPGELTLNIGRREWGTEAASLATPLLGWKRCTVGRRT